MKFPTGVFLEQKRMNLKFIWPFCLKLIDSYGWAYFWALYCIPLIYVSIFMPIPYCFNDYNFEYRM